MLELRSYSSFEMKMKIFLDLVLLISIISYAVLYLLLTQKIILKLEVSDDRSKQKAMKTVSAFPGTK